MSAGSFPLYREVKVGSRVRLETVRGSVHRFLRCSRGWPIVGGHIHHAFGSAGQGAFKEGGQSAFKKY